MNEQTTFVPRNAAYYRAKARRALGGKWGRSIGAMLIASICGAFSMGGISMRTDLKDFGISGKDLFSPSFYTLENLQNLLSHAQTYFWVLFGFATLASAVMLLALHLFVGSPVLLGYERFNLLLIDGETPPVKSIFAPFGTIYLKSIVLRLFLFLISLIASLPTIAAGGIGVLLCFPAVRDLAAEGVLTSGSLALLLLAASLVLLGSIASCVLAVILDLRYGFAPVILAEYPELSDRKSVV